MQTLETAIYSRIRYGELDLRGAALLGICETALSLLPWALVLFLRSRQPECVGVSSGERIPEGMGKARSRWIAPAIALSIVWMLPYISAFKEAWTAAKEVAPSVRAETWAATAHALLLSLRIAVTTGAVAISVSCLGLVGVSFLKSSRSKPASGFSAFLQMAFAFPSGISVMVLGLGFWIAYRSWLDPFEGSLGAIIFLQTVIFTPVAFRLLWPQAQRTEVGLLESAATLGAKPFEAFRTVEWPKWRSPLVMAFTLVAAGALGEVAAVSLFYSENLIPVPLLILRWMGQYRFEEAAIATAVLLLASSILVFGVMAWPKRLTWGERWKD